MDHPLVSICLACYNAEDTIRRAVESALSQNWPNLEILVVDDCSVDNSPSILASLSARHDVIKLLHHEKNAGPAASRNTLIDNAIGDFIVFFDDDDESGSERVITQYKRIIDYEKLSGTRLIACYASGKRVYPNGYTLSLEAIGSRDSVPVGEFVANYILFNERKPELYFGSGIPTCSLMARTEVFRDLGGFDQDFRRVEDMDFAVRLAIRGGHFIGCSERLFTQYATTGADKSAVRNFEAENQLLDKHHQYLEKLKRYQYAKNWFLVRYYHFSGMRLKMLFALAKAWVRHPILVTRHFLSSAPRRLLHEIRMKRREGANS
jgi:glycosyltransferase involved in cell wall biosynthesis